MGVAAVDDDVTLLGTSLEDELDEVVNGLAGHDEKHHTTGLLEFADEFLHGVGADNGLALGLCCSSALLVVTASNMVLTVVQESVDLGNATCLSVCVYLVQSIEALTFG